MNDVPNDTLVLCSRYTGLRLLPVRCASMYRDAMEYREALKVFGFMGFVHGKIIHANCVDCPTGAERAKTAPAHQTRGAPFGNHFRVPKDLTPHWRGKYESERDWLVAMLREYKSSKAIAGVLGNVSPDVITRRVRAEGIKTVRGHGYVG